MTDLLIGLDDQTLTDRFVATRALTESLAEPLSAEDQTVQSMPDVSPTKWHRAHTTWFFETFLLEPRPPGYRPFDPEYGYLFNSYYEGVGPRYPRPDRGLVSRPGHRRDRRVPGRTSTRRWPRCSSEPGSEATAALVELGIHHEQQHQELLLMDIKHVLSRNPLLPAYDDRARCRAPGTRVHRRVDQPSARGRTRSATQGSGFSFDNEHPRHHVYLGRFSLADRPVTCGEWMEFIDDGGYHRPELWLSDGWATVEAEGWESPLYWLPADGGWQEFTLGGPIDVNPAQPVCHVSYYEADAFARWAGIPAADRDRVGGGGRRPWPSKATSSIQTALHPHPGAGRRAGPGSGPFGDVWQWTSSAYSPYPGFEPPPGPSASTTASSWSTSTCSGAARA